MGWTGRDGNHIPMRGLAAVGAGAAIGSVVRYGLGEAFPTTSGDFPWTIFAINVSGAFLLALLPVLAIVVDHPLMPPLLGTGVLGGYTTLSTYAEQTRDLFDGGHTATALLYLFGTLAVCLVAVAIADRFSNAARRRVFEAEEGDL